MYATAMLQRSEILKNNYFMTKTGKHIYKARFLCPVSLLSLSVIESVVRCDFLRGTFLSFFFFSPLISCQSLQSFFDAILESIPARCEIFYTAESEESVILIVDPFVS